MWDKEVEPGDIELKEIARQIIEGFTSGRLDREDGTTFYWELKIDSRKEGGER